METGHNSTQYPQDEPLLPKHGGFRRLKTFQLAELIYDITDRFCDTYIERTSRTHDQMTQAARSGRQNIAEGSVDSAISKKSEMKLTGISKGSLMELQLDYEDYLRQRGLPQWEPNHPVLLRFKALKCATLEEFRGWVREEVGRERGNTDGHGLTLTDTDKGHTKVNRLCPSVYIANGALSLLNLCIYLVGRQMKSQANAFEKEGGFTERLYRMRSEKRRQQRGDTD